MKKIIIRTRRITKVIKKPFKNVCLALWEADGNLERYADVCLKDGYMEEYAETTDKRHDLCDRREKAEKTCKEIQERDKNYLSKKEDNLP